MPRVATGQGQWPEGGPILEVLDWQLARWNFLESSAGAYEPGPACAAAALNIPTFLNKSTFFPKDGVQKGRAPPPASLYLSVFFVQKQYYPARLRGWQDHMGGML